MGPHHGQSLTMWHTVPFWHWMSWQEGGLWTQWGWPSVTLHEVPLGHWKSRQGCPWDALLWTHRGQPSTIWHSVPFWHWMALQEGARWTQWGHPSLIWHVVLLGQCTLQEGCAGAVLLGTQRGEPPSILHAVPLSQGTLSQERAGDGGTSLRRSNLCTHLGHPSTIWQRVPFWQRISRQLGETCTQRGQSSTILHRVPSSQLR